MTKTSEPPSAVFKPSKWPGMIWAVPVAAVLLVGWLAFHAWAGRGPTVTVTFPITGGLQAGSTKIEYGGFDVGEVNEVHLSPDLRHLIVQLDFISSMSGHLGPGTQYWVAGNSVDFENLASVKAILSGPFIGVAPHPGKTVSTAAGLEAPPNPSPPGRHAVAYTTVFPGGPSGLKEGGVVRLEGLPAGSITRVEAYYVPATGEMRTQVDFVLEPEKIALYGQRWNLEDARPQMDAMVGTLIGKGLRAQLGTTIPVVGGKLLQLALSPGAEPARLIPGNPPRIPALGGGADIQQIIRQANEILAMLKRLPLGPIAGEVEQTTSHLAALSNSPATAETLRQVSAAIAHLNDLTRQADAALPDILKQTDATIQDVQRAVERIQALLSAEGLRNAGAANTDLPHALYELSQAAESLRELTDFLNSHPNSLIFGRSH
ncbi:MAG TPA: MlaD family protein [Opitutaceae bacterium]|nr:MlaD family protein [Opitutaceae bacterium]